MAHHWKYNRDSLASRQCLICLRTQTRLPLGSFNGWRPLIGHCLSRDELRFSAVSNAMSELLHDNIDPSKATPETALEALKRRVELDPTTGSAEWFRTRTPNQIKLFAKEWAERQQMIQDLKELDQAK